MRLAYPSPRSHFAMAQCDPPSPARGEGEGSTPRNALLAAVELQHIEPDQPVDDIDQPTLVEHDVVALRRGLAAARLRNEVADFARRRGIGDIDDAQATAEPHRMHQRAGHALVKLMRTEACAGRARER